MSPASLVTSVPVMPIATPISACLSEAASLTPSPVMATTSPLDCRALTTRTLCSGETRAQTPISSMCSASSASLYWSNSAPVTTRPRMPSSAAIAPAVEAWSPVIIFTPMPAVAHSAMASIASGRAGSRMPTNDSRHRSDSSADRSPSYSSGRTGSRVVASASTRSPWEPSDSLRAASSARPASSSGAGPPGPATEPHRARTTSGAPLTTTRLAAASAASGSGCSVAMNLVAESKGTSPTRVSSLRICSGSTPPFAASTTRAPSVGSPTSEGRPSSVRRCASLHSAPATSAGRSSARSASPTGDPSAVIAPSVP